MRALRFPCAKCGKKRYVLVPVVLNGPITPENKSWTIVKWCTDCAPRADL